MFFFTRKRFKKIYDEGGGKDEVKIGQKIELLEDIVEAVSENEDDWRSCTDVEIRMLKMDEKEYRNKMIAERTRKYGVKIARKKENLLEKKERGLEMKRKRMIMEIKKNKWIWLRILRRKKEVKKKRRIKMYVRMSPMLLMIMEDSWRMMMIVSRDLDGDGDEWKDDELIEEEERNNGEMKKRKRCEETKAEEHNFNGDRVSKQLKISSYFCLSSESSRSSKTPSVKCKSDDSIIQASRPREGGGADQRGGVMGLFEWSQSDTAQSPSDESNLVILNKSESSSEDQLKDKVNDKGIRIRGRLPENLFGTATNLKPSEGGTPAKF